MMQTGTLVPKKARRKKKQTNKLVKQWKKKQLKRQALMKAAKAAAHAPLAPLKIVRARGTKRKALPAPVPVPANGNNNDDDDDDDDDDDMKEEAEPSSRVKRQRQKMVANQDSRSSLNLPTTQAMHLSSPERVSPPPLDLGDIDNLDQLFLLADQSRKSMDDLRVAQEKSTKDPWIDRAFYNMFQKMAAADIVSAMSSGGQTQQQLVDSLRQRHVNLPEMTVTHENLLLKQSGEFTLNDGRKLVFPPCVHGADCVAIKDPIPGAAQVKTKRPLMGIMTLTEFAHFMRTGQSPENKAPCVLCHRHQVQEHMISIRPNMHKVSVSSDTVVHLYTNRVGVDNGYVDHFCWKPVSGESVGLFGAVAMYNIGVLSWAPDPDTSREQDRWIILQEGNVHKKLGLPPPAVGETVQDFRKRSTRLSNRLSKALTSYFRLVCAHDCRHALLRYYETTDYRTMSILKINKLRRRIIKRFNAARAIDNTVHADNAYEMALIVDTIRYAPEIMWLPQHSIVCEETVSPAIRFVLNTCFWMQRGQDNNPLVHLLSKVLPQGCRTRRFWPVAKDRIERNTSYNENMHVVLQWFVCSLLGNYHHVNQQTYAPHEQRRSLYSMLDAPPELVMKMFEVLQKMLQFILREQLVVAVRSDPVLRRHLSRLMDWDEFATRVIQTTDQLRIVAQDHDIAAAFYETRGTLEGWPGLEQINSICMTGHKSVLLLFYKRQKPPLILTYYLLHPKTARRRLGAVHPAKPARAPVASSASKTVELDEEEAMREVERRMLSSSGLDKSDLQFLDEERAEEAPSAQLVDDPFSVPDTGEASEREVTQDHSDILWSWICRIPVDTIDASIPIMKALPAFGVPGEALDDAMGLFVAYDCDAIGKKSFKEHVNVFMENWPYTHALLALGSLFWKERSGFAVYQLPLRTLEMQKKAIRENFGFPEDANKLPMLTACVHVCPACTEIRSVHSDPKNASGVPYTHGFIKTASDFDSGLGYCRTTNRINTITGKRCGDEPLVKILLLGRAVVLNNRVVLICAQKACGVTMIVDPANCMYNERGYACTVCMNRIYNDAKKQLMKDALVPWILGRCSMCEKKTQHKDAHLFTHSLVLCTKCMDSTAAMTRIPEYLEAVAKADPQNLVPVTRRDIVQHLWVLRRQVRADFAKFMAPARNRQAAMSRRRTRSRR